VNNEKLEELTAAVNACNDWHLHAYHEQASVKIFAGKIE